MGTVFLFGAGASFGSGQVAPSPPVLGNALIDAVLWSPDVRKALNDEHIRAAFKEHFEIGVVEFHERHSMLALQMLKDVARYFVQFEPGPDNAYVTLIRDLGTSVRTCIFSTTNYDLLIELALSRCGWAFSNQFPPKAGDVCVLKIHGSCNYLPDMPMQVNGLKFGTPYGQAIANVDIKVATHTRDVIDFCESTHVLAPAMAVYGPQKPVLIAPHFIRAQLKRFHTQLAKASQVVVVGLAVNPEDTHIWGYLKRSRARLSYVGPDGNRFEEWRSDVKRSNAIWAAEYFADAIPDLIRAARR